MPISVWAVGAQIRFAWAEIMRFRRRERIVRELVIVEHDTADDVRTQRRRPVMLITDRTAVAGRRLDAGAHAGGVAVRERGAAAVGIVVAEEVTADAGAAHALSLDAVEADRLHDEADQAAAAVHTGTGR